MAGKLRDGVGIGNSLVPLLVLAVATLAACGPRSSRAPLGGPGGHPSFDVVIVPGCPSNADGTVSICQWRRAAWLAHLFEAGVAQRAITSGSAVHNPYVESQGIRAGAIALGVPPGAVATETQALHTDENMAYSLHLAASMGYGAVAVATAGLQARGMCSMAEHWGVECTELALDEKLVRARLADGVPAVRTDPVAEYLTVRERELEIARQRGERRRPPSWIRYGQMARRGRSGQDVPIPRPLHPEPSRRP